MFWDSEWSMKCLSRPAKSFRRRCFLDPLASQVVFSPQPPCVRSRSASRPSGVQVECGCVMEGVAPGWVGAGSEGLVVLPEPRLQKLVRQVVSSDDSHDLFGGDRRMPQSLVVGVPTSKGCSTGSFLSDLRAEGEK